MRASAAGEAGRTGARGQSTSGRSIGLTDCAINDWPLLLSVPKIEPCLSPRSNPKIARDTGIRRKRVVMVCPQAVAIVCPQGRSWQSVLGTEHARKLEKKLTDCDTNGCKCLSPRSLASRSRPPSLFRLYSAIGLSPSDLGRHALIRVGYCRSLGSWFDPPLAAIWGPRGPIQRGDNHAACQTLEGVGWESHDVRHKKPSSLFSQR